MRYITLDVLLNTLDQPTKWEWNRQRVFAINQVRSAIVDFVRHRLDGNDMTETGKMIETLRKKYRINDEDLHAPE